MQHTDNSDKSSRPDALHASASRPIHTPATPYDHLAAPKPLEVAPSLLSTLEGQPGHAARGSRGCSRCGGDGRRAAGGGGGVRRSAAADGAVGGGVVGGARRLRTVSTNTQVLSLHRADRGQARCGTCGRGGAGAPSRRPSLLQLRKVLRAQRRGWNPSIGWAGPCARKHTPSRVTQSRRYAH